jgi:hypothetical protein
MDEAEHQPVQIDPLAARMPRSVTSKRRRKIREQAETITALRAENERLNVIIQVALSVLLRPSPTNPASR